MRKNWRDYLITNYENAYKIEAYVVFEENENEQKNYDLCHGVFSDIEVAKEYADDIFTTEIIYVAKAKDYFNGDYNYLYKKTK